MTPAVIRPLRAVCGAALVAGLAFTASTPGRAARAAAQSSQQTPPQTPQRPPVFRGGTNFVYVDAYPRQNGKVVEGLTAADFQVLEDGVPQSVETFQFIRIEPEPETERRDPTSTREMLAEVADPTHRTFVVYLDYLHVSVSGSHDIRSPLSRALNRIIGPTDLFAVATPADRPTQLAFGRRTLSIEDQLARYWPWGLRGQINPDRSDPEEERLKACFSMKPPTAGGMPAEWIVEDEDGGPMRLDRLLIERRREDRTLTSLEEYVDYLGAIREARTVLLVVSDGWRLYRPQRSLVAQAGRQTPIGAGVGTRGGMLTPLVGNPDMPDPQSCNNELLRLSELDNQQRFRDLMGRANRANVSVYPIAPGGLVAFDTSINEPTASMMSPLIEETRVRTRATALRTIAENTDGIAVVDTNDLDAGLGRIIDDVSAYYLLGYYSTNTDFNGRFRRIEVSVRRPGVDVKARRGYVAPDEKAFAAATSGAAAGGAAGGAADEGLTADAERALDALGRIRPDAELFTRGTVTGDTIWIAAELGRTGRGRTWAGSGASIGIQVATDAGDPVGQWTGEIAANTRGALASFPRPAGSAGPWKATIVIGSGIDRIQDQIGVEAGSDGAVGDAILFRATPSPRSALYPVADHQYRRTERVHVEWPLAGPLDSRSARLLGRDGHPLAVPVNVTERDVDGQPRLAADLVLQPLTDGDYFIELTATAGGNAIRRYVAVKVSR